MILESWKPDVICRDIAAEWEQGDRVVLNKAVLQKNTVVVLYAEARNSPILLREYYIEDRLGFTVVHREGDWVFYHDTGGVLCEAIRDSCRELDPEQMHALFGEDARAVSMSMRNTDIGRHAFRRRSVHAYSLQDTSTGLTLLAELLRVLVDRFGAGDVEHALTEARERRASRRREATVVRCRSAEIAKQAASLVPPDELARARARRALKE